MIANYHTHTYRCGHADPLPESAYLEQAITNGFQVFGFSDHAPWPFSTGNPNPGVRMEVGDLPGYIHTIRDLQKQYWDRIHVYLGLECEYYPGYYPWLDTVRGQFDYLILGNHWPLGEEDGQKHFIDSTTPEELELYFDCVEKGLDTGWFACLAHPEMGLTSCPVFDNLCIDGSYRICRKAKELGVAIISEDDF